jgi:hypothetical protein
LGLPCLTSLCPVGGQEWPPTGQAVCGYLPPPWTPYPIRLWWSNPGSKIEGFCPQPEIKPNTKRKVTSWIFILVARMTHESAKWRQAKKSGSPPRSSPDLWRQYYAIARTHTRRCACDRSVTSRGVWQKVTMNCLKLLLYLPCHSLLCPTGISVLARLQGVRPATILYPFRHPMPYAYGHEPAQTDKLC